MTIKETEDGEKMNWTIDMSKSFVVNIGPRKSAKSKPPTKILLIRDTLNGKKTAKYLWLEDLN